MKNRFEDPVRLSITIFAANAQASDLTNKVAAIEDVLVKAGVIRDDNWNLLPEVHAHFGGVDRENPRAEIDINPIALGGAVRGRSA